MATSLVLWPNIQCMRLNIPCALKRINILLLYVECQSNVYQFNSNHSMCVHTFSHILLFVGCARLLCPWYFPGKNTGVGCHCLLQGIFPTQGLNPRLLCLLHLQVGSLTPSTTWEAFMQQKTFYAGLSLTFKAWKPFLLTSSYINLCYY